MRELLGNLTYFIYIYIHAYKHVGIKKCFCITFKTDVAIKIIAPPIAVCCNVGGYRGGERDGQEEGGEIPGTSDLVILIPHRRPREKQFLLWPKYSLGMRRGGSFRGKNGVYRVSTIPIL